MNSVKHFTQMVGANDYVECCLGQVLRAEIINKF